MRLEQIGFYTLSDDRVTNVSPHSPMMRAEIVLSSVCNFSCHYCRSIGEYMPFDQVKASIEMWVADGLRNIRLSGGEPTLYPHIREVVLLCKELGIERIAMSTNGSADLEVYKDLIALGLNDLSISLDACCADDGDMMAGVEGAWEVVVSNIREISKLTYVTIGIVVTPDQEKNLRDTILFADSLGVADIRIITAAQWDGKLKLDLPEDVLQRHPILAYRLANIESGVAMRGLNKNDVPNCHLVIDDSAVTGNKHYPCIIYMREGGKPIGKVGPNMRQERIEWALTHNCLEDPICKGQCLDVCREYQHRFGELNIFFAGKAESS